MERDNASACPDLCWILCCTGFLAKSRTSNTAARTVDAGRATCESGDYRTGFLDWWEQKIKPAYSLDCLAVFPGHKLGAALWNTHTGNFDSCTDEFMGRPFGDAAARNWRNRLIISARSDVSFRQAFLTADNTHNLYGIHRSDPRGTVDQHFVPLFFDSAIIPADGVTN